MSSWLDRIAVLYKLTTEQLIGPRNLMLAQLYPAYQLDVDPPPAVLAALSDRTGVPVARRQAMTLAGWVPCLTDEPKPLLMRAPVPGVAKAPRVVSVSHLAAPSGRCLRYVRSVLDRHRMSSDPRRVDLAVQILLLRRDAGVAPLHSGSCGVSGGLFVDGFSVGRAVPGP